LDTCKQVFEELVLEHQGLAESFAALQLEHSHCRGLLSLPRFLFVPVSILF
jgi:hypothetical protein